MDKFDLKTELKVIKALDKILNESNSNLTDSELHEERDLVCVMDPAKVCMIVAITDSAKCCIKRFTDVDSTDKEPELTYNSKNQGKAKISTIYLKRVMNLFESYTDSVFVNVALDYPITIEDEHFRVILAPRVEN